VKKRLFVVSALALCQPPAPVFCFQSARETIAKPISATEKRRREVQHRKELKSSFDKWITQDVVYLITDEETQAWNGLGNDEEREQFIEQFWLRRDRSPDTAENEFKEEHYRRIAYANERFASGIPGWKSDRGRMYIKYGPPDQNESHPSGGTYERPPEEGGGTTSTFPFEQWRYRNIEGVGSDVVIEFVDPTMTGEYRLTIDPSEKDALLMVPGAGPTQLEAMGLANKSARFTNPNGTRLGAPIGGDSSKNNQFDRLAMGTNLERPPVVKFKDLALVDSTIRFNILPLQARADFFPLTESSVLTNVTVQIENKDLQFQGKDGLQKAVVDLQGRITSVTGRVVSIFEDTLTADATSGNRSIYQTSVPLAPGLYRLNIIVKDRLGGNMNNYPMVLNVPRIEPGKLASSTLVLADLLEKVAPRSIGVGAFVIGGTKVRPRLSASFNRDEKMGIYMKVYNFTPDEKTKKPAGTVAYEILSKTTKERVLAITEDVAAIPNASAQQVTMEKVLPLAHVPPGEYILRMKIIDDNSHQSLVSITPFRVN